MLAHTLRQSARFAPTQLRQTVRHGSMGGSAQRPIQDAGHDVKVKSKEHSNAIVFGGLAAVGAIAVAWMMADTSDPSKPTMKQTAGDGKPVGKH
ncbi:hypothetical protein DMC30DRAFT_413324 [Rhodotorula diobovata]|uniref:Uncharacterized protein n=1 Tax=Rhodotorula diobovata TaxID=5288 RepID=A0A5C5G737_9BASI|nr:hypothetical protein DMC30DRAFT_413324 [Rhodotorula diobovata]